MALPENREATPQSVLPEGALVGGRYRIVRLRDQGGMGELYEAEHTVTGRRVALKTLSPALANDPEARLRFAREARMLGAVDSRFVVGVLDADVEAEQGGVPFIVMELLQGRNGETLLHRERRASGPTLHADAQDVLPTREIGRLLLEVAKGLSELHAVDLVHRDFSPDNVFLERKDGVITAKLIDLGIAKRVATGTSATPRDDLVTRTGEVIGKHRYMAPDQLRGSKYIDARADIHAFAIVAREFFAGRRSPDWTDPGLPPGLRPWFERAIGKEGTVGFDTMEEAADALARLLEANELRPRTIGRIVIGAIAVIVGCGGAWLLWRGEGDQRLAPDERSLAASFATAAARMFEGEGVAIATGTTSADQGRHAEGTPPLVPSGSRPPRTIPIEPPRRPEPPPTSTRGTAGVELDPRLARDPWPVQAQPPRTE